MKKYLIAGLAVASVSIISGSVGFLIGNSKETEVRETVKTVIVEVTPEPTSEALSFLSEFTEREKTIQEGIINKDYQKLIPIMADDVMVVKEGSGCCGILPPLEAADELDLLSRATNPWIFDEEHEPISSLKQINKDIWNNADFVGISANQYAIAIDFDNNDEIKSIAITNNYTLLTNIDSPDI